MSEHVDDKRARDAAENGILIGKTDPCAESKWSWWEVYSHNEELIACVVWDGGVSCGEKVAPEELHLYCDNLRVYRDGNQWCATHEDFVNLQESPAGFGDTVEQAVAALLAEGKVSHV